LEARREVRMPEATFENQAVLEPSVGGRVVGPAGP
jgi:hypothetical protein